MKQANSSISPYLKVLGVIIPIITIIAAFVLNVAFRWPLFLKGVNIINNMHSYATTPLIIFQNILSLLAHPIVIVVAITFQVLFVKQRARSFVHIIFVTFSLYTTFIFKELFQETRPFWYSEKINILEWFCPSDFGNPSGHSLVVIAFYQPLVSDFLGGGYKKVGIWIWFVFSTLVMVSRMYLAAHSLNQIIFGGLLGLSLLIIYKYKLRQLLYKTIGKLLAQKQTVFITICTTIAFFIFLLLPIVIYRVNLDNRPVDINDLNNINSKCGKSLTSLSLKQKSLRDPAMGFIALGLMYGIIMLTNKQHQDVFYFLGWWSFKSMKDLGYWVLAVLVVVGIPTAILALLLPNMVAAPIFRFVSTAIGATYGAFAFVYLISLLQNKYGWVEYRRVYRIQYQKQMQQRTQNE